MKTKPALKVTVETVRLATLNVAKNRRIVEAEEKLAHAAKVRFKSAKKTWKHARKTAKRSAKKLRQAEKQLATLEKELKRGQPKIKKKGFAKVAKARTKLHGKSRQHSIIKTPTTVAPASLKSPEQNNEFNQDKPNS